MKHIKVVPTKTTLTSDSGTCYNRCTLTSSEGWKISVNCQEPDNKTDREQTLIKVFTPDNRVFEGTIQDFMAIRSMAENAISTIKELTMRSNDRIRENTTDSLEELKHLISLFK